MKHMIKKKKLDLQNLTAFLFPNSKRDYTFPIYLRSTISPTNETAMAKSRAKSTKLLSRKRKAPEDVETVDLRRFAGSSDEEDDDDDDTEEQIESDKVDENKFDDANDNSAEEPKYGADDQENDGVDDGNGSDHDQERAEDVVDDDDDDDDGQEASGMANAMIRILGSQPKRGVSSVILSKTITPLQRQQQEEKERLLAAREKRKSNRDRNLMALHIPLSVATNSATTESNGSERLVKELELERTHRRVATRGVVALFNAIAQHQKDSKSGGTEMDASAMVPKDSKEVKKMTKHGFLDLIKSAAKESAVSSATSETNPKGTIESRIEIKPKWNALHDDYLIGAKMKDWDKQSSDEEEDDADDEPVDDNWDDDNPSETMHGSKKIKRASFVASKQSVKGRRRKVAE